MWPRLKAFWKRRQLERDLQDELAFHLAMKEEKNRTNGVAEDAQRAFGNLAFWKDSCRELWTFPALETCWRDIRYGARLLRRSPVFTLVAVLSLAIGIGANTAVFSLLDAVILKSLPVRAPEQLRILTWERKNDAPVGTHSGYGTTDSKTGLHVSGSFSYAAYRMFTGLPQFSDLVAYAPNDLTVTHRGQSEFAKEQFVSGNYFTGLGANPLIGRPILPEDDAPGKPRVAVITYSLWERRFGLDPSIAGTEILVNRAPVTITGVMPPAFLGLYPGSAVDLFVPMAMVAEVGPKWYSLTTPDNWWVQIFGRIRPGVSDEQAAAALHATLGDAIGEYAGAAGPKLQIPRILLAPGARGVGRLRDSLSTPLYILIGVVGLVLLIACANLANLLLARSAARRREVAVRLSIGASRARLMRQLFTESALLAGAGGLLGLLLAGPLTNVVMRLLSAGALDARIDRRTLVFTFAVSALTSVLFGMLPAWRATGLDLSPALKESGAAVSAASRRWSLSRFLVAAQVALSLLLLVGAGLFLRTLLSLSAVDLGFVAERLLTFQTDPSRNGYKGKRLEELYRRIRESIAAIPGVKSVGMSHQGLMMGSITNSSARLPGDLPKKGRRRQVYDLYCSDSFLSTMRIPLLLGRDLSPADRSGAPEVAVVNETFVKNNFPGGNPVGQTFYLEGPDAQPIQIVGVAKDAHYQRVRGEAPPTAYFPYSQHLDDSERMTFVIRTVLPPLSIAGAVRRAVAAIDQNIPVAEMRTEEEQIRKSLGSERLFAGLVSSFGVIAALLAAIGLYGVMAYSVTRRTAEIGIRLALGANRGDVQWLVLRESMAMVTAGLAIGVPSGLALTGLVRKMLYGVTPADPVSFAVAVAAMIAIAGAAAWLPARRAAGVDPLVALRHE